MGSNHLTVKMIILTLLYLVSTLATSLSTTTGCLVNDEQCVTGDNLIKTMIGVQNMQDCDDLCKKTTGCTAFSYFGPNSKLLSHACMMFSSCRKRGACEDCVTGSSQQDCTCSIPYEGIKNNNNFEKFLVNIEDEFKC